MMALEPEPAIIRNHAFVPEGDWWTQCEVCGLSEAAHDTTTVRDVPAAWCSPPFQPGAGQ